MLRLLHGKVATLKEFVEARETLRQQSANTALGFATARPRITGDFGFMFPELQRDRHSHDSLLPEACETRDNLIRLGQTMRDTDTSDRGDSNIPAIYTYFGQFVDHDITFETKSSELADIASPDLSPLVSIRSWVERPHRVSSVTSTASILRS